MNIDLFITILSLGIAIPFTLIVSINIFIKLRFGETYKMNLKAVAILYSVALLAWAVFISNTWG